MTGVIIIIMIVAQAGKDVTVAVHVLAIGISVKKNKLKKTGPKNEQIIQTRF
jgi:hypothetical protein